MEPQAAHVRVVERVKLLAWEDAILDRAVLVSLVLERDAADLHALTGRVDLADLVEAVRAAHAKLPLARDLAAAEAAGAAEDGDAAEESAVDDFSLPRDLLRMRFVFPPDLDAAIRDQVFEKAGVGMLRPMLIGSGEGLPYRKLGVLGRAAEEEHTGTSGAPFTYAVLLQLLRVSADLLPHRLLTPGRVKEAFDLNRQQLGQFLDRQGPDTRRRPTASRVVGNPLAAWALRRATPPPPVEEVAGDYLARPNEYGLTNELARAFDAHFHGSLAEVADRPEALELARVKAHAVVMLWAQFHHLREAQARMLRRFGVAAVAAFSLGGGVAVLPWLLDPLDQAEIARKLVSPEFTEQGWIGLAVAGAGAAVVGLAAGLRLAWLRLRSPVERQVRRERRAMHRTPELEPAFARAQARARLAKAVAAAVPGWAQATLEELHSALTLTRKAPGGVRHLLKRAETAKRAHASEWRSQLPRLVARWLKFRMDTLDYPKLAALELPPLDPPATYKREELIEKWKQNAAVCFEDDYPTLIVGSASTAAVYFIDVVGSTELSTQATLSNALELYSRMLKQANEAGVEPRWRKEMGDGRIYCHHPHEALKRAVLSAQGAGHPKIGLGIGVGLSVGEIYRDVTTGDFLNEVTNRASRLNGRDEAVGAYVRARYASQPFKVHVKYGRLYNGGIALDDRALAAVGVAGATARSVVPPSEWRFPVVSDHAGARTVGGASLHTERMDAADAAARLAAVGVPPAFEWYATRLESALIFEVFVHKTEPGLRYTTLLGGRSAEAFLEARGANRVAYAARDGEVDQEVRRVTVALGSGESVLLDLKPEKAYLKGLGPTLIAEVEVPRLMLSDPSVRLTEFLASL